MPFKKGESGNPKGRPKGALNRSSLEIKEKMNQLLYRSIDDISSRFEEMSLDQMLEFVYKMAQYSIPKQTDSIVKSQSEIHNINGNKYENMTQEELDEEYERLNELLNEKVER